MEFRRGFLGDKRAEKGTFCTHLCGFVQGWQGTQRVAKGGALKAGGLVAIQGILSIKIINIDMYLCVISLSTVIFWH